MYSSVALSTLQYYATITTKSRSPGLFLSCQTEILGPLNIHSVLPQLQATTFYFLSLWMWLFSVQFSCWVVPYSLQPHGQQHARPPCPSPTPRVYSNSCPSSPWCHLAISSSVVPFSSCLHSFPASGSFPVSQFFTSGGQIIGVSASASVLPMNIQDWCPLGWTGWISLQWLF